MTRPLVEVKDLKKHFISKKGVLGRSQTVIRAVDGISFEIHEGETLGLVGESGCGKSTTGRLLLKLIEPTEGSIHFDGREITSFSTNEMRPLRKDMQMVFQDPYSSLNPRMTVGGLIAEPLKLHDFGTVRDRRDRVKELLELVGLQGSYAERYPHEFSGGQRQRIGIARALALHPRLVICDEPVSALDVSIQSQILNLLNELQERFNLTYLFIAHGLHVVKYISSRVGVMYLGKMMELGDSEAIYRNPLHPYTQSLLSAIPVPEPGRAKERIVLTGETGSPAAPPAGCRFHTRCSACMEVCRTEEPEFKEVESGHYVACHLYDSLNGEGN